MSIEAIVCTPDIGIPLPDKINYVDLKERAEAACNTAKLLESCGIVITLDDTDADIAAKLALAYVENSEVTSKNCTDTKMANVPPGTFMLVDNILKAFSQSVVKNAQEIRNLVTNKLLLESENPDARVRMKALELLGKISDVGLFSEKSEITVTHQSTKDLQNNLRTKLLELQELKQVEGEVIETKQNIDRDEQNSEPNNVDRDEQ